MTTQQEYLKRKNYKFDSRFVKLLEDIGSLIREYEKETDQFVACAISDEILKREYGENFNVSWSVDIFTVGVWDINKPPFDNQTK